MLEQAALIRKQDAAMREMADSLASVRAMAVRYCEFVKADETKRPAEGSPLQ
jgi:hypothetical protein